VLDRIAVPTLVLARRDDTFATPAAVHSLAMAIPGAVYKLLDHHALSLDERFDEVADEIQFFATGARRSDTRAPWRRSSWPTLFRRRSTSLNPAMLGGDGCLIDTTSWLAKR
jgi:hypothetical protein